MHEILPAERMLLARLQTLDELLPTLAGVLDIRDVFERVSAIGRKVIPHDMLSLLLLTEDKNNLVVYAIAGNTIRFPETVPVPDYLAWIASSPWEHFICPDVEEDLLRSTPPARAGYRALLSVPIRLKGELLGTMDLWSLAPNAYTVGDILVARRIADHVALALSHQRLADEARRTAEARALAGALEARVRTLTEELDARTGYRRVVGESPQWHQVLTQATQVASTETTVLLLGESGTGKEVVARFLHRGSPRNKGPFIGLNCAALPEQLLEAELFGYERGAYTGATQSKPGQLEQAAGGTLFLDEVAMMTFCLRAKRFSSKSAAVLAGPPPGFRATPGSCW
jgi:hypothetical protein